MGKKADVLTPAEIYVAKRCKVLMRSYNTLSNRDEYGNYIPSTRVEEKRHPSNVRQLLYARKNHEKYKGMKQVFDEIRKGFETFEAFEEASSRWRERGSDG